MIFVSKKKRVEAGVVFALLEIFVSSFCEKRVTGKSITKTETGRKRGRAEQKTASTKYRRRREAEKTDFDKRPPVRSKAKRASAVLPRTPQKLFPENEKKRPAKEK